jgi:hypothetical protein
MRSNDLGDATDLEQNDLDPERFAAALAVLHIRRLLTYGGGRYGRPGDEDDLQPEHFERFIPHALKEAQRTKRFERHWCRLQQTLPSIKVAWEKGQALFQEHLTRAMTNQEEMEYLSMIDFALDCYAYVSAKDVYPDNPAMQAWVINGYMFVWRQHFLDEDDIEEPIGSSDSAL